MQGKPPTTFLAMTTKANCFCDFYGRPHNNFNNNYFIKSSKKLIVILFNYEGKRYDNSYAVSSERF